MLAFFAFCCEIPACRCWIPWPRTFRSAHAFSLTLKYSLEFWQVLFLVWSNLGMGSTAASSWCLASGLLNADAGSLHFPFQVQYWLWHFGYCWEYGGILPWILCVYILYPSPYTLPKLSVLCTDLVQISPHFCTVLLVVNHLYLMTACVFSVLLLVVIKCQIGHQLPARILCAIYRQTGTEFLYSYFQVLGLFQLKHVCAQSFTGSSTRLLQPEYRWQDVSIIDPWVLFLNTDWDSRLVITSFSGQVGLWVGWGLARMNFVVIFHASRPLLSEWMGAIKCA